MTLCLKSNHVLTLQAWQYFENHAFIHTVSWKIFVYENIYVLNVYKY